MAKISKGAIGIFAAGLAVGTIGVKLLTSKDAKKAYTHGTAAVLRAKDYVVKTATTLQENCTDIYEEAKQINEDRAAKEEVMEDIPEAAEESEETETAEVPAQLPQSPEAPLA